jgi:hypothetical protein
MAFKGLNKHFSHWRSWIWILYGTGLHTDTSCRSFDCPGVYGLFFYLVCEAIGTKATPGLLCQPQVIVKMIVEKQMECRLAGETCPSATFVHHKMTHVQTRVWIPAAAVGSRRLTAWAMARPRLSVTSVTPRLNSFAFPLRLLLTSASCASQT